MAIKSFWKVGDRVIWHRASASVTATILEVRPDKVGTTVKLKPDGWLTTLYERIPEPIRSGNGARAFSVFEPFDPAPAGTHWSAAKNPRSRTWYLALTRDVLVNHRPKRVIDKLVAAFGTGYDDHQRLRKSLFYGPNKVARA